MDGEAEDDDEDLSRGCMVGLGAAAVVVLLAFWGIGLVTGMRIERGRGPSVAERTAGYAISSVSAHGPLADDPDVAARALADWLESDPGLPSGGSAGVHWAGELEGTIFVVLRIDVRTAVLSDEDGRFIPVVTTDIPTGGALIPIGTDPRSADHLLVPDGFDSAVATTYVDGRRQGSPRTLAVSDGLIERPIPSELCEGVSYELLPHVDPLDGESWFLDMEHASNRPAAVPGVSVPADVPLDGLERAFLGRGSCGPDAQGAPRGLTNWWPADDRDGTPREAIPNVVKSAPLTLADDRGRLVSGFWQNFGEVGSTEPFLVWIPDDPEGEVAWPEERLNSVPGTPLWLVDLPAGEVRIVEVAPSIVRAEPAEQVLAVVRDRVGIQYFVLRPEGPPVQLWGRDGTAGPTISGS